MTTWTMVEVYDYVSQNYQCNWKKPESEKEQYQVGEWSVQFDFRYNEYITHNEKSNLGYKEGQGDLPNDPELILARLAFIAELEKAKLENELPKNPSHNVPSQTKI